MFAVGYMAKRVCNKPEWLQASHIIDVYSVSGCVSGYFADYIPHWKHNGYWLFDSPQIIQEVAREASIELDGTTLFYYETYEMEFDGESWRCFVPEPSLATNVARPARKQLEGFDVVTFSVRTSPECSPLSCNSLAREIPTNSHCLLASFQEAQINLTNGAFKNSEPGPFRIFAVYSVDWP